MKEKLKIIPLGGLNEIGKNMTVIEYGNDIVVIDCGVAFPDDDMLGVDLVIPDTTYLKRNLNKLRGYVITHGHEDHIGAIPYVLRECNAPIYATRLTCGIIETKLSEHKMPQKVKMNRVRAGDTIKLGCFKIEFIHTNHSIADSVALAITTPLGTILHTGDFKIDLTPVSGEMIDLVRIGELGKKGLLALMSDSTNVERPGYTPSEKIVGKSLEKFGIAQTSFDIAYSQYNAMYLKVFEAMYGAGGEREIPEADLLAHFTDTYMNYEYFTAPLTKKAEDGTSEDMTDEEKAEVTAALDKLEQQVSDGTLTVEEAAAEYAESIDADPNYVQSVNNRDGMASSYLPDAFITSLESMKEGDIQIFEASNYMVFLHRLPIDDAVEEKLGAEDDRLTLMLELKSEEYQDYVRDSAAAGVDGVELNQEAIDHYKPSMFESTTKNGTSSTAEESSTSSETSASEESSTPSESSAEE